MTKNEAILNALGKADDADIAFQMNPEGDSGSKVCNAFIDALKVAGFVIVPVVPTPAMLHALFVLPDFAGTTIPAIALCVAALKALGE